MKKYTASLQWAAVVFGAALLLGGCSPVRRPFVGRRTLRPSPNRRPAGLGRRRRKRRRSGSAPVHAAQERGRPGPRTSRPAARRARRPGFSRGSGSPGHGILPATGRPLQRRRPRREARRVGAVPPRAACPPRSFACEPRAASKPISASCSIPTSPSRCATAGSTASHPARHTGP